MAEKVWAWKWLKRRRLAGKWSAVSGKAMKLGQGWRWGMGILGIQRAGRVVVWRGQPILGCVKVYASLAHCNRSPPIVNLDGQRSIC